jgi:hypothetical protein
MQDNAPKIRNVGTNQLDDGLQVAAIQCTAV